MKRQYDITFRIEIDIKPNRFDEIEEYLMRCIPRHTDVRSYGKSAVTVQYVKGYDHIEEVD